MISYDDWSDLITVNYSGGMGGDFFSFAIDSCLRDDTPSFDHDDNFKYDFYEDDAFNLKLKSLHFFFSKATKDVNNNSKYSMELFDLHSRIYVERDIEQTISNLRNVVIEKFSYRFNRKRVCSTHFPVSSYVSLQRLFPKSSNVFLSTENRSYEMITKFLFMYKMSLPRTTIVNGKPSISYTMADHGYDSVESMVDGMMFRTNYFPDQLFIDMRKLVVENYNYDQLLSDYCNTKIVLDPLRIQNYRRQTEQIINKYGIDIYKDYTEDNLRELIINAVNKILREKTNG